MDIDYTKIIDFMYAAGKRLRERTGKIADIGITKKDVTEEDYAIERGFKEIISGFGPKHVLYAEEENNLFHSSQHLWVVDPISSTASFIKGNGHYGIVVAHRAEGETVFAAVYDPSVDEMFIAHKGKGAMLNNKPIHITHEMKKILFRESGAWKQPEITEKARGLLKDFDREENHFSMAVNYCWVACGRYDGIVSFTKDSFPEFAGGFIIREAGGRFSNLKGESEIQASDRMFVGGNEKIYEHLFSVMKQISSK